MASTSNKKDVCVCVTPPTCSDDGVHKQHDADASLCHMVDILLGMHIQHGLQGPNSIDGGKKGRRRERVRENGLINGHTKCESIHSPLMM